jgi:hypothetical protein
MFEPSTGRVHPGFAAKRAKTPRDSKNTIYPDGAEVKGKYGDLFRF